MVALRPVFCRTLANQFPAIFAATRYVVYDLSDDALSRAQERLVEFGDQRSVLFRLESGFR